MSDLSTASHILISIFLKALDTQKKTHFAAMHEGIKTNNDYEQKYKMRNNKTRIENWKNEIKIVGERERDES